MKAHIYLAVAALLCSAACSGGSPPDLATDIPPGPAPSASLSTGQLLTPGTMAAQLEPRSVAELTQELREASVPPEVDPAVFAELRDELLHAIATRRAAASGPMQTAPSSWPSQHSVSFTPYGSVNRVDDLVLSGSGPYRLSWTYQSRGDYDLNGMVNVSDLTPVGVYYGLSAADARWLLGAGADGDKNKLVAVSDITPLGQYFGGLIVGYQVWGTADPAGEWHHVGNATVENNLNKNPLRPRFVVELPALDYEYYCLWTFDNSDDEGPWSNIAVLNQPQHRRVVNMESIWHPE